MFIAECSKDSNMESYHYLKPNQILEECLFGIGSIKAIDETDRESEEDFTSSEDENDEESLIKAMKSAGTSIEVSSDGEYHEKAPFNKVKKEGGGFQRKTEEKAIVISSDEDEETEEMVVRVSREGGGFQRKTEEKVIVISSDEDEETEEIVVRVSREDGSIESLTVVENDESDSLSEMIQGLESMSRNNNVDSKTDLKSTPNPELVLPYGWDKMKKEELMEEFLKLNQGKDIPEYLLENLREADYDEDENDVKIEDKKKLKEKKIQKEIKKEIKKVTVRNKGKKKTIKEKMGESEVRLH